VPAITPTTITLVEFQADRQGCRFTDVVGDGRLTFQCWLDFFNDPVRQQRLADSEIDHLRPALAGVIRELENHPDFQPLLTGYDAHTTERARQCIGVIVRIIMEKLGWAKAGRKGALGHRVPVRPRTTTPGAYRNRRGSLSRWFTKAEHYTPPGGLPYPLVGVQQAGAQQALPGGHQGQLQGPVDADAD
jgi:hypothetical protein